MKTSSRFLLFSLIALGLLSGSGLAADPREMTFPPVQFKPLSAERVELESGMILYLLEDHELPIIKIQALIRTGSVYEPADKIALAALTGTVMRTGGTKSISGDALDEELEFIAAGVGSGIGLDAGFASLNVLKKDLDRGLELFADMLMHPVFPEEKLDLAKKKILEGIRRRNDNPSRVAGRTFRKLVYGDDHPLARESSVETINRITRDDLIRFHQDYYFPNSVIMAISGDFTKGEMVQKIREAFSGWTRGEPDLPPLPPIQKVFQPSVNLIKKDISQTHIRIGHLGIRRDDPDYFAVTLLDDILGSGGFRSRLFQEIRTRQGLAYSVGSVFVPGNLERGRFVAYIQTKASSTYQAISAILEEIKRIRTESVTEQELRLAKDSFLNSFVFSFSSPSQIVSRQSSLEYYGLPSDYLERFRDRVVAVTREEVQEMARKHLRPDGMIILAVGRPEEFDRPLSIFGKTRIIQLDVP